MRLNTGINSQRTGPFIGLILAALLLGFLLALPLGHQLFHSGETELETCPVHLLESSLLLLAVAFWSLSLLCFSLQDRPLAPRSVPLPLFCARFFYRQRPPPHS